MRLAAGGEVINVRRRWPWRITYYSSVWLCHSASNRSVSSALQPAISQRLTRRLRCPARAPAAPPAAPPEIRAVTCRLTAARRTATWTSSPSAPNQLTWWRHENKLIKMPSPYLMVSANEAVASTQEFTSHNCDVIVKCNYGAFYSCSSKQTPLRLNKVWLAGFLWHDKYFTLRTVTEVLVPRQSSWVLDFVFLRRLKPRLSQWGQDADEGQSLSFIFCLLRLCFGFEKDCSKRVFTVSYGPSKNKPMIIKDWGQIFLSDLKTREVETGTRDIC